ncbi:MAG TPA: HAMP domain-containing sensor histidine kinase [Saprospiraceae bacterium]|nr:HAMP domain-containing sensor histidine kinase [Saprospiraceae bacterium]
MKLWQQISAWKGTLVLVGLVILGVSMWYTNYLAIRLSDAERERLDVIVRAHQEISNIEDLNADISFYADILLHADDIPLINTDMNDKVHFATKAFGEGNDTNIVFLQKQIEEIKKKGPPPIINPSPDGPYKIYYKESRLLQLLTYFPLVQLLLIGAFVAIGFMGISSARRAEQNRVWVGMAKETAHQLGTPISAILAWIEHLKERVTTEQQEIVQELRHDVEKLELVADRFSKIGSAPVLERTDLRRELAQCRDYMARRASRHVKFEFDDVDKEAQVYALINPHLFDWVIENMLRNALDALEGEGKITATVHEDDHDVYIDISDTGKGIPQSQFKKVFEPGFTTKQRGWGLGLSLAKRIIEQYHSGKIFVKKSKQGEGTTFTIKLPKAIE